MLAAYGTGLLLAGNQSVSVSYDSGFTIIGQDDFLGFPIPAWIAIFFYVAGWIALERHAVGRRILAIGDGEATARLMGLKVERTLMGVYITSGLCAGMAGVILASQFGAGQPTEGVGWELFAIASVVVGGTLLTGGVGSVGATLAGALLLAMVFNILNFENGLGWISLSAYWQSVIRGLFLLAVVVLQAKLAGSREMRDMEFSGKSVLVTGAGKGIGLALAKMLAARGAKVVAISRSAEDLKALDTEIGSHSFAVDLADAEATRKAARAAIPVDYLVNCAGTTTLEPFLDVTLGAFDRLIAVNTRAPLIISQEYARDRIARKLPGAIVNVSSNSAFTGFANHAAYCASKGALDAMSRVMANELGPHGIRVNCVNPAITLTPWRKRLGAIPKRQRPCCPECRSAASSNLRKWLKSSYFYCLTAPR